MSIDPDLKASIAATRFGLGARPSEIAACSTHKLGLNTYAICKLR